MYDEAVSTHESAYFEAAMAGASEQALSAAYELGYVITHRLERPTDGERWLRLADVIRSTLPDPTGVREVRHHISLASLRKATRSYEEAATLNERAMSIAVKALGPQHPAAAVILNNLANVRRAMGDHEAAGLLHERALGIREEVLGPDHPRVADSLNSLANVRRASGDYEAAAALHERALGIQEKALDPEHPDVALSLNNLANVRYS